MRCLSCLYDLRNLAEHRCPECGREFDPNDPSTFCDPVAKTKKQRSSVYNLLIITGIVFVLFTFLMWILVARGLAGLQNAY